jgi:mannose-6-phosphate isomerase
VHAYQHGLAVEIMASSDNVLRAGLTTKHMDVPELLATIAYVTGPPTLVEAEAVAERTRAFPVPVDDFLLSVTDAPDDVPTTVPGRGPRILLCLDGPATVEAGGATVQLARGESVFVPAADGPVTVAGPCRVIQADVP